MSPTTACVLIAEALEQKCPQANAIMLTLQSELQDLTTVGTAAKAHYQQSCTSFDRLCSKEPGGLNCGLVQLLREGQGLALAPPGLPKPLLKAVLQGPFRALRSRPHSAVVKGASTSTERALI
jgi:hypothetical protein